MVDTYLFEKTVMDNIFLSQKDKTIEKFLNFCEELQITDKIYTFDFMILTVEHGMFNVFKYLLEESKTKDFIFKKTYDQIINDYKSDYTKIYVRNPELYSPYIYNEPIQEDEVVSVLLRRKGFDFVKNLSKIWEIQLKEYKNTLAYDRLEILFNIAIKNNNFDIMKELLLDERFYLIEHDVKRYTDKIYEINPELIIKLLELDCIKNDIKNNIFNEICRVVKSDIFKKINNDIFNKKNLILNRTYYLEWLNISVSVDNIDIFKFLYEKIKSKINEKNIKNIIHNICYYNSPKCLAYLLTDKNIDFKSMKEFMIITSCKYDSGNVMKILFKKYDYTDITEKILSEIYNTGVYVSAIVHICQYSKLDIFINNNKYIRILDFKISDLIEIVLNRPFPIESFDYSVLLNSINKNSIELFKALVNNEKFDITKQETIEKIIRSKKVEFLKYLHLKYPNLSLSVEHLVSCLLIFDNVEMFKYTFEQELFDIKKHSEYIIIETINENSVELLIDIIKHKKCVISEKANNKINNFIKELEKYSDTRSSANIINKAVRTKKINSLL